MHLLDGNDGRSAPCGRGVRRDGVSWAGRPGRKLRCRQGGGPSAAHRGAVSSGMGGWDTRTGQGTAPSQGWRRCGRSWRDRRAPGLASAGHSPAFPGPRNTGRGATETHRARKSRSGRTAVCTASPRRPGRGRPFRTWTGPRRHREAKEPPEAAQPPPPVGAAGPRPQLRRRDKRGVRSHVPRGWAPIWGLAHPDEGPAEPPAPGRLQEGPAAPGPAPPRRPPAEHLSSPAGECRLSGLPGWQRSCRAVQATPSPRPPRLSAVRVPANPLAAPQAAPSSGPRPPHGAPYPTASQPRAAQPGRGLRAVTGSCGGTAWRLARTAVDSHGSTRRRYHGHGGSSPRPRCGRTHGPHRVSGGQRVRLLPTSLVARTTHTREHTVTGTLNG